MTRGLCLALLVASCCAFGAMWFAPRAHAEIPPEWLQKRIVELEVVGEQRGRVDLRELGIPIGAVLSRALIRDAIFRLGESGRWANIEVDAELRGTGIALFFKLSPRLVTQRVDVFGSGVLDEREVLRLIGAREQNEIDPAYFPTWIKQLRDTYARRGYHQAQISLVLRDTEDPAMKVLRVEIDQGPATRIREIVFVGEPLPKRKGVGRVLRFEVGDVADEDRIRSHLERAERVLHQTGYYAAQLSSPRIEVEGQSARVLIPSVIGPNYEVRFRGQEPLERSELFAAMKLDEERFSGETSLYALQNRLVDLYRRHGFREATAELSMHARPRSLAGGDDELVMVIDVTITPGEQTEIVKITFPGAQHFDDELLRDQIFSYLEEDLPGSVLQQPVDSDVADRLGYGGGVPQARRDVPRPMLQDPHRLFYAPTYTNAVEHIRDLYRADGFLAASVGEPVVEPLPEKNKAVVVVPISEGPRTFVYEVRVEGNEAVSSREVLDAAQLERGAPFSYLKLEEARVRALDAYREKGYFYATVEPRVRMSEDGTRAEVVFEVVERFIVRIGGIDIQGAERSNKSMIKNRLTLHVGDIYRPSEAQKTQDALLALDVFTSVSIAPEQVDLPGRVKNIVISLVERKTQFLGWNAGFSTGEGVRGGFEYGYRNLFGSAVHTTFRGQLGYQFVFLDQEIQANYERLNLSERIEYQATLTTAIPYIPHLPKNSVTVDLVSLNDIQRDFRMQKESIVGTIFHRVSRKITLSLAEELESTDFELISQNAEQLNVGALGGVQNVVPDGQNTLASSALTGSWDLRDRNYNPTRGVFLSGTGEWARTLTDDEGKLCAPDQTPEECEAMPAATPVFRSNFLRVMANVAFYVPLLPKLVFANSLRYGRVVHLDSQSKTYPNRRFYLGGTNFRGYYQNQVIPADLKDVDPNNIISHGGDTFIALQSELRFPLYRELYAGLFTDIGNVWADPKALDLTQLRTVFGAGLRFQTPVASLALDYGIRAFEARPFEVVGAFQFAFQTF